MNSEESSLIQTMRLASMGRDMFETFVTETLSHRLRYRFFEI